ncbi:MAG: aspartyl aminopeptidase [Myxococcota bacterium]|jgi:aspartyl aminopeptidase
MNDLVADLLAYIDASPTPYHAVAETERRLSAAGYECLDETALWSLAPGSKAYVVRGDGGLVAFHVGSVEPAEGGFRIVGAHTDSPNLRVKPQADVNAHGYHQLAVEPYGGVLLHTWLDRDLSLAGRVTLAGADGPEVVLIDFARPLLRVPNLAIHLNRTAATDGLILNAQQHMVPLVGLEGGPKFRELLMKELDAKGLAKADTAKILGFDLMTYDTQPSSVSGAEGEFIHAPRLDNLALCHAGVTALLAADADAAPEHTRVVALYDHEEVGSRSATGAGGPLLENTLERIGAALGARDAQASARAIANSVLVSADMAHAVHPNYSDRHEAGHRPVIGKGPVIKYNQNQSYATDAVTSAAFVTYCEAAGVAPQYFVSRSDLSCGSTIGPITAARLGIATVDVGNPMLSMHSCREMAGTADVKPMIDVLAGFYA